MNENNILEVVLVGGDHGKETVDIAVPFFVNALK